MKKNTYLIFFRPTVNEVYYILYSKDFYFPPRTEAIYNIKTGICKRENIFDYQERVLETILETKNFPDPTNDFFKEIPCINQYLSA
jgi:hypothetical protein